ncbi:DJ-1/PfpI family protein [Micromonospora sp. NPDC049497]|uniref:DJ-1/PfpI family protein n=1 Tax=Micromonospora sp. NPDC049497 TaxID=3364273 RepID=UPI00379E73B6
MAEQAGAEVHLISLTSGEIQSMNQDIDPANHYRVDRTVNEANAADYDALLLPGGTVNPGRLRINPQAMDFVRAFFQQQKPVAAICHGPWSFAETGIVNGRTVTSVPSLRTDIRNAGGNWVDQHVQVNNGLVTATLRFVCRGAVRVRPADAGDRQPPPTRSSKPSPRPPEPVRRGLTPAPDHADHPVTLTTTDRPVRRPLTVLPDLVHQLDRTRRPPVIGSADPPSGRVDTAGHRCPAATRARRSGLVLAAGAGQPLGMVVAQVADQSLAQVAA